MLPVLLCSYLERANQNAELDSLLVPQRDRATDHSEAAMSGNKTWEAKFPRDRTAAIRIGIAMALRLRMTQPRDFNPCSGT